MPFTDHDLLARIVLPAVSDLKPGSAIMRDKRVDYAIGSDGRINPNALLLLGVIIVDGVLDNTLYSTASTVTYTTCGTLRIDLPDGTWTVMLKAMSRGGNTLDDALDYRTTIQSVPGEVVTRGGPSTAAAPFMTLQKMTDVSGGQQITLTAEFKSDATGTSSVSDTVLDVTAIRTA